jgi:hypothetical protein
MKVLKCGMKPSLDVGRISYLRGIETLEAVRNTRVIQRPHPLFD